MARIIKVDPDEPELGEAAEVLNRGGIIAYPTDTLYGLGASIQHEAALKRVYEIKGRDSSKPLLLLIPDGKSLQPLVKEVSDVAQRLMEAFWPGPLTLVFKASKAVSTVCSGGGKTVAIRWPKSKVAKVLLLRVRVPLTATSANLSGGPQSTSAQEVIKYLGDQVDLVVDGGPCPDDRPSTLVDVSGPLPLVLREGRISYETLEPFIS